MTIHAQHPFLDPERDPLRRFRGRMAAPVTVLTCGEGRSREGWTVSSLLVADGETAEVIALVDADSDFAETVRDRFVVNLLSPGQQPLADAFARVAPAPGGPFRMGTWTDTKYGPVLAGAAGWLGVEVTTTGTAGWLAMLQGKVAHVEVADDAAALAYVRGRYLTVGE